MVINAFTRLLWNDVASVAFSDILGEFSKKTIKMRIFDVKRNFAKYHTIINIVTKATSNVTGGYKLYVCTINS